MIQTEIHQALQAAKVGEQSFSDSLLARLRAAIASGDRYMVTACADVLDGLLTAGGPLPGAWSGKTPRPAPGDTPPARPERPTPPHRPAERPTQRPVPPVKAIA